MYNKSTNISIEDSVLIKQYQHGNAGAMGLLITKYQDRLYNSILKICGNPDDAAELTQETFVKVLEAISAFRSESSFYTWLYRIGINLTLTFCRKRLRLGMRSLDNCKLNDNGEGIMDFPDSKVPSPSDSAAKKDMYQQVLAALEKLDDNHRAVIVLRDIEDMSYEQIAEILQIEQGTVKSRLSRARIALRDMMRIKML